MKNLPINTIVCNPLLWARERLDSEYVESLADVLREGGKLPPISVRLVDGTYHCTDGRHILAAHKAAGRTTVSANVRNGSWADAASDSISANQGERSLPLTRSARRKSVLIAIYYLPDWSSAKIAQRAGVSRHLVDLVKQEQSSNNQLDPGSSSLSDEYLLDEKPEPRPAKTEGLDGKWRGERHQAPKKEQAVAEHIETPIVIPPRFVPRIVPMGMPDVEGAMRALSGTIDGVAAFLNAVDSPEHERCLRMAGDLRSLLLSWAERKKAM